MAAPAIYKVTKDTQKAFVTYVQAILTAHRKKTQIFDKMEVIDRAYARYKGTSEDACATVACNIFDTDKTVAPIVISQVDSLVAYLADVFLSGAPLFPVVSTPARRKWAEQLETLLDDHADLGGYVRQLLLHFRDTVKYNFGAIEADWDCISQFSSANSYLAEQGKGGQELYRDEKYFTRLTRLDPYNTIWDDSVAPADVATQGDYAGHIELLSKTKLKRLINKLSKDREAYNATEAMNTKLENVAEATNYRLHPQVSEYVTSSRPTDSVDWISYIAGTAKTSFRRGGTENYEKITLYVRILPSEFGVVSPSPNTHQIWKLIVINGSVLLSAKRIISAYDQLPIYFSQPQEDGLRYQTKSLAEGQIPIQEAATTLFNIRFAAARRAVSDRALYDSTMLSPNDVNSPAAAPKLPVRIPAIGNKTLADAYHSIPFDMRGTETTLQDAAQIVQFGKELSGLNNARQGQFQKGNKSVQEWNDVMGSSDNRLRLTALLIEHQIMVPIKAQMKLNIFQYGQDTIVVSQKSGEALTIKMDELRREVLAFRVADGYSPKSKLASVEMLTQGMNMLMNSPILQQAYGKMLPAMFAHLMQLGGVKGLEEYSPELVSNTAPQPQPGLAANGIQPPPQELSGSAQPNVPAPPLAPNSAQQPMPSMHS